MRSNSILLLSLFVTTIVAAQQKNDLCITGYYAGPANRLDSFPVEKLTHLIFSFGHLKGNKLNISAGGDTVIRKMLSLKKRNPGLRIILSLGGWGGCESCSPVFSTKQGRDEFAASVKELTDHYQTDGIDLDWEYPAIAGYPGHPYNYNDKVNFTLLIRALRKALGRNKEISFAAGGFNQFIDSSIEWKKVMKIADKVYVMSYDLVHGYSTTSGHHTPLFSTDQQAASANNAISRIMKKGVAPEKIVIGAAFYARMFQVNDTINKGLYRPGSFYRGISYADLYDSITRENGFTQYWDDQAFAPYAFNPGRKILVTYDDHLSVSYKTRYAIERKLGGIMFWQLADDKYKEGLLDVIFESAKD